MPATLEPTTKSPQIEGVLRKTFGFDRRDSIRAGTCVPSPIGCGRPVGEFRDSRSEREFTISGMCQKCQDDFFGA